MSIRTRIAAAIFISVALVALIFGWLRYQEAYGMFNAQLDSRAEAMADSFQVELEQTRSALADALMSNLVTNATLPDAVTGTNAGARYRWALENRRDPRIDILKVQGEDGRIVSSRHWPTSFGVQGDLIAEGESLVMEPVQDGTRLSLQMIRKVRSRDGRAFYLVVGRFLGPQTLKRTLERTDADVLVICVARYGTCWDAVKDDALLSRYEMSLGKPVASEGIHFVSNELFEGQHHKAVLWAGVDKVAFETLAQKELFRILWGVFGGLILALVMGFFLGHHIGRPLSLLSKASLRLADGELDARVETPPRAVAEVGQLVESFNLMASELEQNRERLLHAERVATWQEIAKGLAHELKNPLTPILGALKVVRRARDKQHPDFDLILQEQSFAVEEEVMRLKNMADSFARFARLPDPLPEPICLLELLDTVLSLYAGADKIAVEKNFPEEAPMVADAERLRTLFTNLVKNASDAMAGEGTVRAFVKVMFESGVSGYEVRLEDTGPGIAPQVMDKLFMPYVTTKADGGTGLGLALGLRIVTEMGGRISVDADYESGAAFVIWLPAASHGA
ncbi:MAG: HAMP domain-containing histidine kinase [Deltaproteobacteria bacterium]|jgi:signal transduction histidine kinase|nr:HAMP domain-containing histidine kinase [Deltaproteobacteria bacterium]MBT6432154.1 HAMP domain-containing histidine kinase [Deltaproteobacteria bacterium]